MTLSWPPIGASTARTHRFDDRILSGAVKQPTVWSVQFRSFSIVPGRAAPPGGRVPARRYHAGSGPVPDAALCDISRARATPMQ